MPVEVLGPGQGQVGGASPLAGVAEMEARKRDAEIMRELKDKELAYMKQKDIEDRHLQSQTMVRQDQWRQVELDQSRRAQQSQLEQGFIMQMLAADQLYKTQGSLAGYKSKQAALSGQLQVQRDQIDQIGTETAENIKQFLADESQNDFATLRQFAEKEMTDQERQGWAIKAAGGDLSKAPKYRALSATELSQARPQMVAKILGPTRAARVDEAITSGDTSKISKSEALGVIKSLETAEDQLEQAVDKLSREYTEKTKPAGWTQSAYEFFEFESILQEKEGKRSAANRDRMAKLLGHLREQISSYRREFEKVMRYRQPDGLVDIDPHLEMQRLFETHYVPEMDNNYGLFLTEMRGLYKALREQDPYTRQKGIDAVLGGLGGGGSPAMAREALTAQAARPVPTKHSGRKAVPGGKPAYTNPPAGGYGWDALTGGNP